ncbi:MAG: hypothetical protein ACLFVI_05475 [Archaeoglobaceae archaeon]
MEDRGISPLIGFILIMLLVVMLLGVVQSTIPDRCKKEEAQHMDKLERQVFGLKNVLPTTSTQKLDLGVSYPQYLIFMTPNAMSTTVSLEEINLTVEYKEVLANGSRVERERDLTTTRITVSPNYLYYPQEDLILENSAYFKKVAENKYIPLSNQTVFKKQINLDLVEYPFHGPISFSGSRPIYITEEPISTGGSMLVEDFRVTFESVNPHYWEGIPNYDVKVNGNEVTVEKSGPVNLKYAYALLYTSYANTEVDYSNFTSQNWDLSSQTKLVKKIDRSLAFSSNETELLDVLVTVDGYNNPVGGYRIESSTTLGEISPQVKFTDEQGEALFVYSAPVIKGKDEQEGTIEFTCQDCTQKDISFQFKVLSRKLGCDSS